MSIASYKVFLIQVHQYVDRVLTLEASGLLRLSPGASAELEALRNIGVSILAEAERRALQYGNTRKEIEARGKRALRTLAAQDAVDRLGILDRSGDALPSRVIRRRVRYTQPSIGSSPATWGSGRTEAAKASWSATPIPISIV